MSENSENGPFPPESFDELLKESMSVEYDKVEGRRQFAEMIEESLAKTEAVIARLREVLPDVDLSVYRAEVDKQWQMLMLMPGCEDGFSSQLMQLVHKLPEPQKAWPEGEVTASKLEAATEVIRFYPAELQAPFLQAIDIISPHGQQMSLLSPDEIRFMNLAHNGGSPEREVYYRALHRDAGEELNPVVSEKLARAYGPHDDLGDLANAIVSKGAELATLEWERFHTQDTSEDIREKRYRDGLFTADLSLNYYLGHTSLELNREHIDEYVDRVRRVVFRSLREEDGIHKH